MGNTYSGKTLVYNYSDSKKDKDSSHISSVFQHLSVVKRVYAGHGHAPAQVDDDDIEDPVEQMLKKTGCLEKHYSVLECIAESKDWRKCQQQVKDFKECMDKHKNRSTI